MDLQAILRVASEQLEGRSSHDFKERGNKFHHGQRVAKLAVHLRELLFPNDGARDDVLTAAAWLHDVCNGEKDHGELGAELTRKLIAAYCTEGELDELCELIRVHDERKPESGYSDAIKLLQDADMLDHFGTNFIWVWFAYAVPLGQNAYDAREWQRGNAERAERHRNQLNFDLSRRIFDDKQAFVAQFAERFSAELDGEIWDEKTILNETFGGAL
ncbi:MAG: HD domain-containing protein [Oscillospiraceae bacterium]|jgi:uncharacterized protein|nr:HD domain-containing protein [Oscillospiraceae bacterium]